MLDMVQHIIDESKVNISRCELRIVELAQNRLDIANILFLAPLIDVVQQALLDVHGVHLPSRSHSLRQGS